jgi:RNA polymerase sigma-70 factor (ECF subfamily)
MLKVFRNIAQYSGSGEPEAWIRRIVVNTCIDHCRLKTKFSAIEISEEINDYKPLIPEAYDRISSNEILEMVESLPRNTCLVFNLFVNEGYRHEEIGKMLGISEGTSKWHLNEARKLLKQKLDLHLKKEHIANAI